MVRVYVGIGSNIDREYNIKGGISALKNQFGEIVVSSIYESHAYGFDGDNFYNLVAGFNTDLPLKDTADKLRAIEYSFGRKRLEERFLPRTLDIDLLLFGNLVRHDSQFDLPRDDILRYAFVLCPLAEIAGQEIHPELGKNYSELWANFENNEQQIWPASLSLSGHV